MWKVMLHATFWFLLVLPIVEVGQQKEWKVSIYLLLESWKGPLIKIKGTSRCTSISCLHRVYGRVPTQGVNFRQLNQTLPWPLNQNYTMKIVWFVGIKIYKDQDVTGLFVSKRQVVCTWATLSLKIMRGAGGHMPLLPPPPPKIKEKTLCCFVF